MHCAYNKLLVTLAAWSGSCPAPVAHQSRGVSESQKSFVTDAEMCFKTHYSILADIFLKWLKLPAPSFYFFFGTPLAGPHGLLIAKMSLPKIRSHSSPKTSCHPTASRDLLVLAWSGEMLCLTGQKEAEDKAKERGHLIQRPDPWATVEKLNCQCQSSLCWISVTPYRCHGLTAALGLVCTNTQDKLKAPL